MSISKLEIEILSFSGGNHHLCPYVCLNPIAQPGHLVFAGAQAARNSIASQVASTLSLEQFAEHALSAMQRTNENVSAEDSQIAIVEEAFRQANTNVYKFGHTLAAGGKTSASLIGVIISNDTAAAGKAGTGSIVLFRSGASYHFFDEGSENESRDFIGERSLVNVELASVALEERDVLLLSSQSLSSKQTILARRMIEELPSERDITQQFLQSLGQALHFTMESPWYLSLIRLGPEAIYLSAEEVCV